MRAHDISGNRYGRLVAVERTTERDRQGAYKWRFMCDCGRDAVLSRAPVMAGRVKSCGCLFTERLLNSTDRRSTLTSQINLARARLKDAEERLRRAMRERDEAVASAEKFRLDNIKLRVRLKTLEKGTR